MVVRRREARVEHEPQAGRERVGAEERVLAAVALVPAQGRLPRHEQAERGQERRLARAAARQVRRLDLQVADPAPRRLGVEGARAADEGARELGQRPRHSRAPARRRHDVGVEEHDRVAARLVPAHVAGPAGEAAAAGRTTCAPCSAATSAVASVEPSSTTITSAGAGSCAASASSTRAERDAASRAGMTTL